MKDNLSINRVIVLDKNGVEISTMYANKALKLIGKKEAEFVSDKPLTIRLLRDLKSDSVGDANDK